MTALDIAMIVTGSLCLIIGLIGCIIPGLPGTPLCWGALLASFFAPLSSTGWPVLVITGVITVAVEIINDFVPSFFTKHAGGSKAGSIGSIVGVFAGVITGQIWAIFLGPFIGAFIGEIIHDHTDKDRALKSALWAFLGFITGSGLKLITGAVFLILFIKSFF